jgi:hypothetical protein
LQLLSFRTGETSSFGALVEGRIVDLGRHLPEYDSLKDLLERNGIVRALDTAAEVSPDFRLDKVDLLSPLVDSGHLLCVFDEARDEPVSVDPKFVRGHRRPLMLPADDVKPVAAGVVVAISMSSEGPGVLGYTLMTYLSPATLAAGPWLLTPEELPGQPDLTLDVSLGERKAEITLPDPTGTALQLAAERSLSTGDLVAVLHYLPELSATPGDTIEIDSPELGTLNSPIEVQPS